MKIIICILFIYTNFIFGQEDYSDSLFSVHKVENKLKINRFSTRTIQTVMLNEINKQRLELKLNILDIDSSLYKGAKSYSLYMLKNKKYEHSKIPEGYIEFIGHSKLNIKTELDHKHLALQELLGFMQTDYHKSVLMNPNIKHIGIAMSAKLRKFDGEYYYDYYIVIHIYE